MTIHAYPDGTTATHPAMLDTRPTVAQQLGDVMDRTIDQLDHPATFIPAVADERRDDVAEMAVLLVAAQSHEVGPQPPEFWRALGRLTTAVHAWTGGAA